MDIRTGLGYDLHRLHEGGKFILGNVEIPYEKGFVAHSDGDVLIHSIIDALLGAANLGDIGSHFPDTSADYKGIDSSILLEKVVALVTGKGYTVGNIDATVICEAPKLRPHIERIKARLAEIMGLDVERISVKAKTNEKVDAVGEKRAVEVFTGCLISR